MWTIFKHKYDVKRFSNESQLNTKYLTYETSLITKRPKYEMQLNTKWHNTKPHLTRHDTKRHFWHEIFLNMKN